MGRRARPAVLHVFAVAGDLPPQPFRRALHPLPFFCQVPPLLATVPRNPDGPRQIHRFPYTRYQDCADGGARNVLRRCFDIKTPLRQALHGCKCPCTYWNCLPKGYLRLRSGPNRVGGPRDGPVAELPGALDRHAEVQHARDVVGVRACRKCLRLPIDLPAPTPRIL